MQSAIVRRRWGIERECGTQDTLLATLSNVSRALATHVPSLPLPPRPEACCCQPAIANSMKKKIRNQSHGG